MKTILSQPVRTADGTYIIDGWHIVNENGDGFALVRNVGWVRYSNKLSAVLIPNVGWRVY